MWNALWIVAASSSVSLISQLRLVQDGDADGIGLLKAVGADQEGRDPPGQHDQRDRIQQRIGQAGDRIGRARTRGDQNDAGLAGRTGIALGHVDGALFVADQNMLDVVLLKISVIDG